MKRNWKALILGALMSVSLFGSVSCSKNEKPEISGLDGVITESTSQINIKQDGKTLMNGFEYFDRDIQLIRLMNEFGIVSQNRDKEFVRTGEASLKLNPLGARLNTANPAIMLPTTSIRFSELSFGNFQKVDNVSMWIYNAESENLNVGIALSRGASTGNQVDSVFKTNCEYYTLLPGWNYLEYTVQPKYLEIQGADVRAIYGVVVEFDYVLSHKLADSPTVYIDDVCLMELDEVKTQDFVCQVESGITEQGNKYWTITNFEDPNEAFYYFYSRTMPAPLAGYPRIQTVLASDYNLRATNGARMLKIDFESGNGEYGWPSVQLCADVIKNTMLAVGQDLIDNPQNYAIKMDVYNASDEQYGFGVEYSLSYRAWNSMTLLAKTWGTFSINIGDLDAIATAAQQEKFSIAGGYLEMQCNQFRDQKNWADRTFFFDNVRIEKIN